MPRPKRRPPPGSVAHFVQAMNGDAPQVQGAVAPIGVALIAKNASATIGRCLDSFRPYVKQVVVCVDETTTDDTAAVAKAHGAEVHPVRVSDWHECAVHGKVLAQHFANARNESFRWLDPSLDYWMWIDSDDVLEGAENLAELCRAMSDTPAVGAWLEYHYAHATAPDGTRQTNTLFHRERLLRTRQADGTPIRWEWKYRVHEVIAPDLATPQYLDTRAVRVVHQDGAHKTESSAPRNLRLLEIDYEEDPSDPRTLFYIANQYFAMGQWADAAHWYEQLAAIDKNPYQLWQSLCYLNKALQRLGEPQAALDAALKAIKVVADHPEPYYAAAEAFAMLGEWEKVVQWTREGRTKKEPPFFVFKNPLDYAFNQRLPLADALGNLGRISEARAELEEAFKVMPDPRVGQAIARYREIEDGVTRADALVALLSGHDDAEVIRLWEAIDPPAHVRAHGRIRDVVMPAYIRRRQERFAA